MRILIDVNHPAHVHLFRLPAKEWEKRGHDVLWTARDKDVVVELLQGYGIPFRLISAYSPGFVGLALEMISRDWKLLRIAHQFRPDVMLGTSVTITHVAHLVGSRSIYFTESNPDVTRLITSLSFPFADTIVTPDNVPAASMPTAARRKWVTYPGYHELAYLHPNHFTPDPTILKQLGVSPGAMFFVLRLIGWGASHDAGQSGLNPETQKRILDILTNCGRVFITAES